LLLLQLLNSLSQQLAAAPLAANRGSVHCLLLQLLPTANAQAPVSMGRLKLAWRRKQPAEPAEGSTDGRAGGSTGGSAGGSNAPATAAADAGPVPGRDVEAWLQLPQVVVRDSLMSVKAAGPQNVTAGTSFPFTLQVRGFAFFWGGSWWLG
jgi:hypothetical protein